MSGSDIGFLSELEAIVKRRIEDHEAGSYTASLVSQGRARIAQKLGEEALELAIATASDDRAGELDEAADLVYHLIVLLAARDLSLSDVAGHLRRRHEERSG